LLRAHWTPDFAEAHIVETLLRAEGIQAWVFDGLLVRQDWFKTLMFGGYRIMVPDADGARALEITRAFRNGELSVPEDEIERPPCPRCDGGRGIEDPRPRRGVFALLIVLELLGGTLLLLAFVPALFFMLSLLVLIPGVLAWTIKWRYRCPVCRTAWRAPPQRSFAAMARDVEASSPAP
jgi:hypothetical protein